ncbi:hypothetical protein ADEAN_000504500 [Angomonas deanei]|uniref:Uncharacterized protein n=1 Tax=Angomonas deanei TaxID=59799 RepID=A0A7G2CEW7_9TRYP|nr:hypothetical protein ADEAN_000504500 [Angomonas deanei]
MDSTHFEMHKTKSLTLHITLRALFIVILVLIGLFWLLSIQVPFLVLRTNGDASEALIYFSATGVKNGYGASYELKHISRQLHDYLDVACPVVGLLSLLAFVFAILPAALYPCQLCQRRTLEEKKEIKRREIHDKTVLMAVTDTAHQERCRSERNETAIYVPCSLEEAVEMNAAWREKVPDEPQCPLIVMLVLSIVLAWSSYRIDYCVLDKQDGLC